MSIIYCPECKAEISSEAFACPHCGYSIKEVTVERTNKKWKLAKLISILLIVIAVGLYPSKDNQMIAISIGFIGLCVGVMGKIGAWWNNR